MTKLNSMYPPPFTKPNQTRPNHTKEDDTGGDKRKYEVVVEEGRDPRVPRPQGPKVQWSHGPSYLKVTFKYELDSKEGPSCSAKIFKSFQNYCSK